MAHLQTFFTILAGRGFLDAAMAIANVSKSATDAFNKAIPHKNVPKEFQNQTDYDGALKFLKRHGVRVWTRNIARIELGAATEDDKDRLIKKYGRRSCIAAAVQLRKIDVAIRFALQSSAFDLFVHSEVALVSVELNDMDVFRQLQPHFNLVADGKRFITKAIDSGHFDMFKYLHEQGCSINGAVLHAAYKGRLSIVRYLCEMFRLRNTVIMSTAARHGHLDIVKFLHHFGCPMDESVMVAAATNSRNMEVVRYLCEHGCPMNSTVMTNAVQSKSMEMVTYLHEQGCPMNSWGMATAVEWGSMEIIRYLCEHDCPMDSYVMKAAVKSRNMEIIRYLCEHGCPMDSCVMTTAAKWGSMEIIKFLTARV